MDVDLSPTTQGHIRTKCREREDGRGRERERKTDRG